MVVSVDKRAIYCVLRTDKLVIVNFVCVQQQEHHNMHTPYQPLQRLDPQQNGPRPQVDYEKQAAHTKTQ